MKQCLSPLSPATFNLENAVLRMSSGVSRPGDWSCSVVWLYGSRYFCICCQMAWVNTLWLGRGLSFSILWALCRHLHFCKNPRTNLTTTRTHSVSFNLDTRIQTVCSRTMNGLTAPLHRQTLMLLGRLTLLWSRFRIHWICLCQFRAHV